MALAKSDLTKKADNKTCMDLGEVLPITAEIINGHLVVGGVDMCDLAKKESTALYVLDEKHYRFQMQSYQSAFASHLPGSKVIYASKAFLNKAAAKIVSEEGLYLDVSGGGELAIALAAGFDARKIIVHGNNKTPQEIKEALTAGVGIIVVDSRVELKRLSEIAASMGKTQDVYMRVTPGVEADTHEYVRTGCEDSKFGFTTKNDFAFCCIEDFLNTPNVKLKGLHCHIGSQIFSLNSFEEAVTIMVEFAARIEKAYNYKIGELDVGGGLGVAYLSEDKPASIKDLVARLSAAFIDACKKYEIEPPVLAVEPGRSIVANAGMTLYTVGIIKTLPNIRKFVAIDGGMSDNIRTALYHSEYEAVIANKADQPRCDIVTLCGKHCESGDVVAVDAHLQKADIGDIVCVFGTGAYNYTMASNYNGQPRPAVVFVKDGVARITTRRETYSDLMARDID